MAPRGRPLRPARLLKRPGREETDWVVIMLGFIAILFLLGLIPLWVLVFQAWTG